jgi:hypothetical protein
MKKEKIGIIGIISLSILFVLLTIAGYISYKHIDWDVLKRIESQQLILPTPIPQQSPLPTK